MKNLLFLLCLLFSVSSFSQSYKKNSLIDCHNKLSKISIYKVEGEVALLYKNKRVREEFHLSMPLGNDPISDFNIALDQKFGTFVGLKKVINNAGVLGKGIMFSLEANKGVFVRKGIVELLTCK